MKKFQHNDYLLLSFLGLILLYGCANSIDSAWKEASTANTVAAYEAFIKKYPNNGDDTAIAKKKLEILEWQQTTEKNSIESYKSFKIKHPNGY